MVDEEGASDQFGARSIRRLIEQEVENAIAGKLVRGELGPEQQVILRVSGGELELTVEGKPEATL